MPPSWLRWGKKVAANLDRYEFHHQDETHVETNPYLCRIGIAAGSSRRYQRPARTGG